MLKYIYMQPCRIKLGHSKLWKVPSEWVLKHLIINCHFTHWLKTVYTVKSYWGADLESRSLSSGPHSSTSSSLQISFDVSLTKMKKFITFKNHYCLKD